MRITEEQLRKIIKEELEAAAGTSKLTDQQKKQLNDLSKSAPSSLASFSKNLKTLSTIIDDIDPKVANINTSQLTQYWSQMMAIAADMMSEEKTSASATAKITKALG